MAQARVSRISFLPFTMEYPRLCDVTKVQRVSHRDKFWLVLYATHQVSQRSGRGGNYRRDAFCLQGPTSGVNSPFSSPLSQLCRLFSDTRSVALLLTLCLLSSPSDPRTGRLSWSLTGRQPNSGATSAVCYGTPGNLACVLHTTVDSRVDMIPIFSATVVGRVIIATIANSPGSSKTGAKSVQR